MKTAREWCCLAKHMKVIILIALNMFKEKPIFGHGPKMFRFYCAKEENFVAPNACTTHPHNFYAQMLVRNWTCWLLRFLLTIFLYILFLFLKKSLFSDSGTKNNL